MGAKDRLPTEAEMQVAEEGADMKGTRWRGLDVSIFGSC